MQLFCFSIFSYLSLFSLCLYVSVVHVLYIPISQNRNFFLKYATLARAMECSQPSILLNLSHILFILSVLWFQGIGSKP